MNDKLKGIIPAIISPCDEKDSFREDNFAELAENLYKQGVHGLYVCGATGDAYNLRLEERKRAADIAVSIAKKFDGTTIVHIGTSNTRDAIELAEHAALVNATAIASMPPANRNQKQLVSYYTEIAGASGTPLLVYHLPHVTGQNLTLDNFKELFDIPTVVGIKFSDSNLYLLRCLFMAKPDIVAFNGNDELLCPGLLYGAQGGIGMTYNLFPKLFLGIYQAVQAGDISKAMDLQNRFIAFLRYAFAYGIRSVLDFLMRRDGFGPFAYRRPREVFDELTAEKFLKEAGHTITAIEQAV